MGKAYTEEEREQIRTSLLEAGLELFHEGVKKISIRELTTRVGIAQGSFYSFFSDKDDLVKELIHYRTSQKLQLFEAAFDRSLSDPAKFVNEAIFHMAWDLKQKSLNNQMYDDIFRFYIEMIPSEKEKLYTEAYHTMQRLSDYWNAHGIPATLDVQGIMNVVKGALILCAHQEQLDEAYAGDILKTFIRENCKHYISMNHKER